MADGGNDLISPARIDHNVDEVWDGDRLEQRYVYIDYYFKRDGMSCRARAYTDDLEQVSIFGLLGMDDKLRASIDLSRFERDVFTYLERRFGQVVRNR